MHIGTNTTYSPLSSVNTVDKINISQNSTVQSNPQGPSDSIQVNLSPEARDKLAQEQSELGQKLAQQLHPDSIEETKESESNVDTEFLEKLIEQTEEQIKEVQQERRELNNDNSEQAQQEKRMLDSQLVSLNGTLLGLFGKKLTALE